MASGIGLIGIPRVIAGGFLTGAAIGACLAYKKIWVPRFENLHQNQLSLKQLDCKILLEEAKEAHHPLELLEKCKQLILTLPPSELLDEVILELAEQYQKINRLDEICVEKIFNLSTCDKIFRNASYREADPRYLILLNSLLNQAYKTQGSTFSINSALNKLENFLGFAKRSKEYFAKRSKEYQVDFTENEALLSAAAAELACIENGVDKVRGYCLFMEYYHESAQLDKVKEMQESATSAFLALNEPADKLQTSIYLAMTYRAVGDEKAENLEVIKILGQAKAITMTKDNLLWLGKMRERVVFAFDSCVDQFKSSRSKNANQAEVFWQISLAYMAARLVITASQYLQEALSADPKLPGTVENGRLLLEIIRCHHKYFSIQEQDRIFSYFVSFYTSIPSPERIQIGIDAMLLRNTEQQIQDQLFSQVFADIKTLDPENQFKQLLSLSRTNLSPEQYECVLKEAKQLLPKLTIQAAIQFTTAHLKLDLKNCREMSATCTHYLKWEWRGNVAIIAATALFIIVGLAAVFRPSLVLRRSY